MYRLAAIAAVVLALPIWSPAAQARHVDQGCDSPDGGTGARTIWYYMPMGQSFYPTEIIHAGVELYIRDQGGGVPEVTIKLRRSSISGSIVAGTTVTETYSGNGWVYFEFPSPVNLTPGQHYVIDISAPDTRGAVTETGDECCPGNAWIFGGEFNQDFYFHTYIVDGACCFMDGTCQSLTEADCEGAGGNYEGNDTDCTPNPCPQPGACCFTDGSCHMYTQIICTVMGGYLWLGGEDCSPNPCPQPGACCFADGSCQYLLEDGCTQAGGYLWIPGTPCNPNPCPQPGACCFTDGSCQELPEDDCTQAGGDYWLGNEVCDLNPCDQP